MARAILEWLAQYWPAWKWAVVSAWDLVWDERTLLALLILTQINIQVFRRNVRRNVGGWIDRVARRYREWRIK